jgi:rubrerythrin
MKTENLRELLYQTLETELGGAHVYQTALRCAQNDDLKTEWEKYLRQTNRHVEVARRMCEKLGLDPEGETPGRSVARHTGQSLVQGMELALASDDAEVAQVVAAESVMIAETKDHQNWVLIGKVAKEADGELAETLQAAYEEIEDEEDEHLYRVTGWTRELWMQSLGMKAVLPPPEEDKDVKTELEAACIEQSRVAT